MPKVLALSVLALLVATGCDTLSADAPVEFDRLSAPPAIRFAGTAVFRDPAAWEAFWQQNGGDGQAPDVDFDSQTVVGVFYGGQSGCDPATAVGMIESADSDGAAATVKLRPLPNLGPCDRFFYPAEFVAVDTRQPIRLTGSIPS